MSAATPEPTKVLGPRQQRAAKREAEMIWLWGIDLVTAVSAGEIQRAADLSAAIASANARLAAVLDRAK